MYVPPRSLSTFATSTLSFPYSIVNIRSASFNMCSLSLSILRCLKQQGTVRGLHHTNWIGLYSKHCTACVEIEDYSVVYFDCIPAFEVLYHWTSIESGAHKCFVNAWTTWTSNKFMKHLAMPFNLNSAIQRFECGDAAELSNGIIFDFYTGLQHILWNCEYWDVICVASCI